MIQWFTWHSYAEATTPLFSTDTPYGNKPDNGSIGPIAITFGAADAPVGGSPTIVTGGEINRVHFRLNPTNAVTYRLTLYQSVDGADGTYQVESNKLFDSTEVVAAAVGDTEYDAHELVRPFVLDSLQIWLAVDWSAAPGNTTGYCVVSGKCSG